MKFNIVSVLAALAAPVAYAQDIIQLHGSGTTNPSKCYWHIMDLLKQQSKQPTHITYRAVGSSTGQAEFIGDGTSSDNDFGSGDIPFSQEDYDSFPANSIYHLPIVLGPISFFHSVPTGEKQLNLDSCVLAKILNRDITDWTDPEILDLNPGLNLPSPYPITVARRVLGSSSTSSITQYLSEACPEEWPATQVGSTIEWPSDTSECEGSGGMTDCITSVPGTIGYIESGHGHAEGLQEIELQNADGNYLSSKEAAENDGIMSATENANLPTELDGSFADVNLLNRPGEYTWPIVAMSYVYVRKDISFLPTKTQGLLKAFLNMLYDPNYIDTCVTEFGFNKVTGSLRDKALAAIDSLNTTSNAPEFTFEFDTEQNVGQGPYVISAKRESYSEVEQDKLLDTVNNLILQVETLKAENEILLTNMAELEKSIDHTHDEGGSDSTSSSSSSAKAEDDQAWIDDEMNTDTQLKAALALGSISFILWMLAVIYIIAKFVLHV